MARMRRTGIPLLAVFFLTAGAHAQSGWGVAVLPSGTIYFSDIDRDQVWKLDPAGKPKVVLSRTHCHNLVPAYDGSIYGEAVGMGRGSDTLGVWRLTPEGNLQFLQRPAPRPDPSLWVVHDLAGNGYAWHGESERTSRILKRTPEGNVSVLAGGAWGNTDGRGVQARFAQVGGLAVTPGGTVYLTDSGHLRRIRPGGAVETLAENIVGSGPGGLPGDFGLFNHSMGVAVDAQENVYIVDRYRRRVVRWDLARGASVVRESPGLTGWLTRMGLAWFPTGIAAADGELYVLETFPAPRFVVDLLGSPRLTRLRPDGTAVTVASAASSSLRAGSAATLGGLILGIVWWAGRRRAVRRRRPA